ncbi:MAG: DUF1501 domain-containing protein [Planctomycetaceae bacterium]|nr:DUF1501 domain-containing protein [Planctomycetaceae bacterium]
MFDSACGSADHLVSRRSMLGNLLAGAAGVGALSQLIHPAVAKQIEGRKKQVLIFLLNGGLSQFESFDPKPKTDTGGPFRAIPTSVPGTHFSELMPFTAKQAHRLAVVRSMFAEKVPGSHGGAREYVVTGRPPQQGPYPWMGPAFSTLLGSNGELPGNIHITPARWGPRADAAFLGPRNASLVLSGGQPPRNIDQPELFNAGQDDVRYRLRTMADQRFSQRRRTAHTEAYQASYDQASRLIRQKSLFDVSRESEQDRQRYGSHDIGRHCLMARRLLEQGVTCVKVTHNNYDSHMENFNFHLEQLGEFDRPFATLLEDLDERGMLDHTLVMLITEFGRTPEIQPDNGRDHWPPNWSVVLGGCGVQVGGVLGATNANGTEIVDRPVHVGEMFHTYVKALGLDPKATWEVGGNQVPIGAPERAAVSELLS